MKMVRCTRKGEAMFFTVEKLNCRIEELRDYAYRDEVVLKQFLYQKDEEKKVAPDVPTTGSRWEPGGLGMNWAGRDAYLWIKMSADIPETFREKTVVGLFDFGTTGSGNNRGFESLLYMDGKPYQGVDTNHREVFFPDTCAGARLELVFRLWSGLEGGGIPREQKHEIRMAKIVWLDKRVDEFYYRSGSVLETIQELSESDSEKHRLLTLLNQAFYEIDWSYPGSDAFYQSVYQADACLRAGLEQMEKHTDIMVHCVGHTHIDLAWLWRTKHTREKASRSFSTVLRLMERYPDYYFLQSMPQIYEYVKQDFPDLYQQIKERIREGRWEVDGAMWVEADCNLTSGESLTRQILYGRKFVKEEFGQEMHYLWLPDVFGYSWALPQILKKSGIDVFMTTKISWSQYNRMPHDTFLWKGLDGSEVITHFVTTPDLNVDESRPYFYTYNGELHAYTVKGVWDNYQDKELNRDLLISYGYGDGGGGVNRDELERRRQLDEMPGLPRAVSSRAGEYFKKLKQTVEETESYVHVWDGELYLEYHRGTYTSQAYNKMMNRRLEERYREAEWLSAMVMIKSRSDDLAVYSGCQGKLNEGWKIILRNQFHDIIPGSSIREVYQDSKEEYSRAMELADQIKGDSVKNLIKAEPDCWTIINNSNFTRNEVVVIPECFCGVVTDTNGNILKIQKEAGRTLVYVEGVLPMSLQTLHVQAEQNDFYEEVPVLSATAQEAESPFYRIQFNEYGHMISLYDKMYDREVLAGTQGGNVFYLFEDKPMKFDAWDIDIFHHEKMQTVTELMDTQIAEIGNLRAVIRRTWRYRNTIINQDMILYANDRRIDFKTHVDYHERHQLLKVSFPVNIRTTYATYDIQYGNVRRPNNWNTSWEMAKFESVGHRFADLSEYDYGVSLINNCKYGYDIKNNEMRLTLIKSATEPDYDQDQGEHDFVYSILPHQGDFVAGGVVPSAYACNQPLQVLRGSSADEASFIWFSSDLVELDAVKRSEDGIHLIIRFHEFAGSRQKVGITINMEEVEWAECNLMEELMECYRTDDIVLDVAPYEIKTIAVRMV